MRPRIWFLIGFLLVCVGLLVFVHIPFPSPRGVVTWSLWWEYATQFRAVADRNNMGAASNAELLSENLFVHGLLSVLGGCVTAGAAWAIGKRKGSKV